MEQRQPKLERRTADELLAAHGCAILFLAGIGVTIAAVLVNPIVGTALAVMGVGAMVLAVVLPRSEGPTKIGPQGLEFILQAIQRRTDTLPLPAEEKERVRAVAWLQALRELRPTGIPSAEQVGRPTVTLGAAPEAARNEPQVLEAVADALADRIVRDSVLVTCANCGRVLPHLQTDEPRTPCPTCGSTAREFHETGTVTATVTATGSEEVVPAAEAASEDDN